MSNPLIAPPAKLPDPALEIRIVRLHATRGINFWSKRPIVRMDLAVGEYDHISSADIPGFTDGLIGALPGLVDHECSIGARGGFRSRLRRGTYAPHIIEHVALELQMLVGHDVGYGRTRGGDQPGEYTLVFEHRHEQVGLRAAALALDIVQRAFAGMLDTVQPLVNELKSLGEMPDPELRTGDVFGAVTGGSNRMETQDELRRRLRLNDSQVIVDLSPAYMLQVGLPYSGSGFAIVLDTHIEDVPVRYRDRAAAQRLLSIVADGVTRGGLVTCPAKEWEIQDYARDAGCRVAIFAGDDDITKQDQQVAIAVGRVAHGQIVVDYEGETRDEGPLDASRSPGAQVAAALTARVLHTSEGNGITLERR